jgi:hypothetical protein
MQEHIQPEDIDFLLDGDEGFASFPLRKHLAACAECRARLERAQAINEVLEHLPHVPPRGDFASRVMDHVQVFEPWHVTVVESARRMVPRQRAWRVLAGVGVGGVAISVSALAIWVSMRLDLALYAAQLGLTRLQATTASTAGAAVSSMFGESALVAVREGGMPAIVIGLGALVTTFAVATLGLRRLLTASRRRQGK